MTISSLFSIKYLSTENSVNQKYRENHSDDKIVLLRNFCRSCKNGQNEF